MSTPDPRRSAPSDSLLRALGSAFTLTPTTALAASTRSWYAASSAGDAIVSEVEVSTRACEGDAASARQARSAGTMRRRKTGVPMVTSGVDDHTLRAIG